jgi:hypothetical protein
VADIQLEGVVIDNVGIDINRDVAIRCLEDVIEYPLSRVLERKAVLGGIYVIYISDNIGLDFSYTSKIR